MRNNAFFVHHGRILGRQESIKKVSHLDLGCLSRFVVVVIVPVGGNGLIMIGFDGTELSATIRSLQDGILGT